MGEGSLYLEVCVGRPFETERVLAFFVLCVFPASSAVHVFFSGASTSLALQQPSEQCH